MGQVWLAEQTVPVHRKVASQADQGRHVRRRAAALHQRSTIWRNSNLFQSPIFSGISPGRGIWFGAGGSEFELSGRLVGSAGLEPATSCL